MKRSFRIRIHPAGAVLLAAAALFCPSAEILAGVVSLALHEGAHLLAMQICGIEECMVEITPFGGMADSRSFGKLSPCKQAICAAAGICTSLAAYAAIHPFAPNGAFQSALERVNLSLAFVNCLPVWPLDGARVLTALASSVGIERAVRKALAFLAKLTGIGLTVLGLYGAWQGWVNPSLLMCGPYLCYASAQGSVSHRVRQMELLRSKLETEPLLPVHSFACLQGQERRMLSRLLSRNEWGRYQIVFVVDPASGRIVRAMSEQEALEDIVGS